MRPAIVSLAVLLLCFVYAAVRYVGFGGVLPDQLPVYVANKALSWAGVVMITLAVGARPLSAWLPGAGALREDRRSLGMVGLAFCAVHTVMSLMLLSPAYYAKFYVETGRMTTAGEVSMLAGACSLALLVWQSRIAPPTEPGQPNHAAKHRRALGTAVLALALLHVGFMGWPGWFTPAKWHGGMPPITLLSAAVAALGVALGLMPRRNA
ncbi:MAG: hypothetical protein ACIAXF_15325 [Phycisphaerales bacterium JB063]